MKYVFFGTPRFAAIVLEQIIEKMPPIAVVTNPDRPAGRKKILTPPAVKTLVQEKGKELELLQPEKLSEIKERLIDLKPDLFVVAAYGKIIPQSILDIPSLGTIGVHPSLLPKYRGASPIQTAILNGEEKTGMSLYLMDAEVDHGPVLAQEETEISEMNYLELEAALAKLGGDLLLKTLPKMKEVAPEKQDESKATFTTKFETQDGFIDWKDLEEAVSGSQKSKEVWQKIRALDPEPGAWTEKGGNRIKLLKANLENDKLVLKEIQKAGKNPERISGGLP